FVNRTQGSDLRGSEATVRLRAGALDFGRIPAALTRIGDQPIGYAILSIAGFDRRALRQLQVGRGEAAVVPGERLVALDRAGLDLKRVDGRTSGDGVIVTREALRLHQRHAPAGGTALEIGAAVRLVVIRGNQFLARDRHF